MSAQLQLPSLILSCLFAVVFRAESWCFNGIFDEDGSCKCIPGFYGDFCQHQNCVHGNKTEFGSCICDENWVGRFCNTTEHLCVHGKLLFTDICSCDSGWTGDNCEKLFCFSPAERVSDTECKCTYSGVYPNCGPYKMSDATVTQIVFGCLGFSFVVFCIPFTFLYRRRQKQKAQATAFASQQIAGESLVIPPPGTREVMPSAPLLSERDDFDLPPPSYDELFRK